MLHMQNTNRRFLVFPNVHYTSFSTSWQDEMQYCEYSREVGQWCMGEVWHSL